MPREQREKQRQQMIAARRATLKYMGTPRSIVLAQLIQEEATKQCAQILLPKNVSNDLCESCLLIDINA